MVKYINKLFYKIMGEYYEQRTKNSPLNNEEK